MTNTIIKDLIEKVEVKEKLYAPDTCILCAVYPAVEGAICADCIFDPIRHDTNQ